MRSPSWRLTLRVIAVLSWIVSILWLIVEPGYEPLLAFLGGVAVFLGSFAGSSAPTPHGAAITEKEDQHGDHVEISGSGVAAGVVAVGRDVLGPVVVAGQDAKVTVRFREKQKKRDALRDFLGNDVQSIGSSVVSAFYHIYVPSIPHLAERLDKAIRKTKTMEMVFITEEEIKKTIVGMGNLGRLAWDQRINEEKIDLFFEYKERLENALVLLEEELTGLSNLVDDQEK